MTLKPALLLVAASLAVAACASNDGGRGYDYGRPEPVPEGDLPPLGDMDSVDIDEAPVRGPVTGDCGMENFADLVGQPASMIDQNVLPDPHRVVPHNGVITMDYRPNRLTIRIGENGAVETVACG